MVPNRETDSETGWFEIAETEGKGREGKGKKSKEKEIPDLEQVVEYLTPKMAEIHSGWTPTRVRKAAKVRLETFIADGWKDGNGSQIKNWKTKFMNCMKHEKHWNYEDAPETPQSQPKQKPEPEGWQKVYLDLIPNGEPPLRFAYVDDDIQRQIKERLK